jgi:hypothetical protein
MVKIWEQWKSQKRLSIKSSPPDPPSAHSSMPVGTCSNGLGEVNHARCYCVRTRLTVTERSNGRGDSTGPLLLWYLCENMAHPFYFPSQKEIINQIFSTGFSFHPQLGASGHTCAHVYQQTCIASERRTRWSSKLLDIFDLIILL